MLHLDTHTHTLQQFGVIGLSNDPKPKGPKIEKITDRPPGLKISSETFGGGEGP